MIFHKQNRTLDPLVPKYNITYMYISAVSMFVRSFPGISLSMEILFLDTATLSQ
jgi:hypothetical protein